MSENKVERRWHMYIWTKQPFFHAVAQAENVDEARSLMLEEIGGGDGSCPEREKAAKWVRDNQPTIFHRSNAEFSLTDSAELREQEAYTETVQKKLKSTEERVVALESALKQLDKVLCDHSEITENSVVYWFDRYVPELDAAVQDARRVLRGEALLAQSGRQEGK